MKFHLRVYDNFHYMDESEAYNHGEYETYEEALIAAKAIVEEFFVGNWKTALTARDLAAQIYLGSFESSQKREITKYLTSFKTKE